MPSKESADWTTHPEDLTHLLEILHDKKGCIGDGGNFDKTVMNETAVEMATKWPPKKGRPKTAKACTTKWKATCKLYEYILPAKQKAYPGASGWTYSDELGFNMTDDDQEAWSNFTKAHPHFKPFATCGWAHFITVDEIVLLRTLGCYVFSPGTTQPSDNATPQSQQTPQEPSQPSQGSDEEEDTTNTQPYSDWSQSNFGDSQLSDGTPIIPASQSTSTPVSRHARTLSATSKRSATDEIEPPWSSKRSRTMGPESILALGCSVDSIGKVIETVFAPPKSSAMSPAKKVDTTRRMALEDLQNGYIMSDEHTQLHILFRWDTTAADAYISDNDPYLRADIARELLNPTQNFNYH